MLIPLIPHVSVFVYSASCHMPFHLYWVLHFLNNSFSIHNINSWEVRREIVSYIWVSLSFLICCDSFYNGIRVLLTHFFKYFPTTIMSLNFKFTHLLTYLSSTIFSLKKCCLSLMKIRIVSSFSASPYIIRVIFRHPMHISTFHLS